MAALDKPDANSPDEPGQAAPGERSGVGARTLWHHLEQDTQRKSFSDQLHGAGPKLQRSKFSVLVVDDQPAGRYALTRALQSAGYDILSAAGGAEALQLADRQLV